MKTPNLPIKIFILNKDNYRMLRLCVRSIINRTAHPCEIIIVDNNSSEKKLLFYYDSLLNNFNNIHIVRNKTNLWVLGLNPAMKKFLSSSDGYFVVTDSDIVVPVKRNGRCWLERLVHQMNTNVVIGKLGISLDLGYIKGRANFASTYSAEVAFYGTDMIGDNYISPVDTTIAIYRRDFFMFSLPKFFPGHGVLSRPFYYVCRTNNSFLCKHIGWRSYQGNDIHSLGYKKSKAICFSFMGAYLDTSFLKEIPFYYVGVYKLIRPIARLIWAFNVLFVQLIWFIKYAPFRLNDLQYKNKIKR